MVNFCPHTEGSRLNNRFTYSYDINGLLAVNDTTSIALEDVDGDGDIDLVEGNQAGQANRVYHNDGTGVFTDTLQTLGSGDTTAIALGDIDGDGDLDLVTANTNGQANRVYRNDGTGVFTDTLQTLGSGDTTAIALGDIDGDGDLDLFAGDDTQINLYSNNGSGAYLDVTSYTTNASLCGVFSDVDSDGDRDLVVGTSYTIDLLFNQGDGTYAEEYAASWGGNNRAIAMGDFNLNGHVDMLVGRYYEPSILFQNNGTGIFLMSGLLGDIRLTTSVATGDVDGDGDLDIVQGNMSEANRVYINSSL